MVAFEMRQTLEMQANPDSPYGLVERRQSPRLNFVEPVQFRNILKPHELYTGAIAQDLGASGLRIRSEMALPKEQRLLLQLSLPGSHRVIRAIARVAWDSERSFGSGSEAGLQFIGIAPEDQGAIAGFVERGVVS